MSASSTVEPAVAEASAEVGGAGAGGPARRTLPPMEIADRDGPRSAASLALSRADQESAVPRRFGARAELASLEARLRAAQAGQDTDRERELLAALARALVGRGEELDVAVKLARRSLLLGDDPTLQAELSTWLAGLGESAAAGSALRTLAETQSAAEARASFTRSAVLLGRAGDATGAAEVLEQASRVAPGDPLPHELLGALGAWASDSVQPERAAAAYLAGSALRDAAGERAAAFEDLLRAFEMAPSLSDAAQRLAAVLRDRGRPGAADHVLRLHARALAPDAARAVHLARIEYGLQAGDLGRALGAAFDAGFDAELEPPADAAVPDFDQLLDRVGLHELLAARLALRADLQRGRLRSETELQLARVLSGPLASADRAVDAWIDALVADPANEAALEALRVHAASTHDQNPLVEALLRVGLAEQGDHADAGRVACLRELWLLAEQRLSDPGLALWAVRRLLAFDDGEPGLREAAARLAQRARLQDETLAAARAQLDSATGAQRIEPLRRVASVLRGRPDDAAQLQRVLAELTELVPDERSWLQLSLRLQARDVHDGQVGSSLREAAERAPSRRERDHARLLLAGRLAQQGQADAAVELLAPALAEGSAQAATWSLLAVLAARVGDSARRADALQRLAAPLAPTLRAVLLSIASDAWLAAGDSSRARSAAEQACRADPSLARPVAALAAASAELRGPERAAALERALSVIVPRADLCEALAIAQEQQGDPTLALVWTQRWLALRPSEPRAAAALLERVTQSADAARIADTLGWLMSQAQPISDLAQPLAAALGKLAALDPTRGAALARRALDVVGARHAVVRQAVQAAAVAVGDRGLGIAALERWLASSAAPADRGAVLLEVAEQRRDAGDVDGAARALLRAVQAEADPRTVLAALQVALPPRSTDGELALLEARAECLQRLPDADPQGVVRALRELGAARWDLAGDSAAAIAVWQRAAALDPEHGLTLFARDVVAFSGHAEGVRLLRDVAQQQADPAPRARVLAFAATLAFQGNLLSDALDLGLAVLEVDASRSDMLAVVERSAGPDQVERLEYAYELLNRAVLGCFGERAVHYRAARQLERRGEFVRALKHAVAAFEAVPVEGVAFVLMARLAEQTGEAAELVRSVSRIAGLTKSKEGRARWLKRAAVFAGVGEEGARLRVDVLLRALAVRPDVDTVRNLGAALAELLRLAPDERETAEMRFENAAAALLPRLDGPEGARTALATAHVALTTFGAVALAVSGLLRAMDSDADVDEYDDFLVEVARIAAVRADAQRLVKHAVDLASPRYANVGRALTELGVALGEAIGDLSSAGRLLVLAARKSPDDRALAERAERAAQKSRDPELLAMVLDAVPPRERVATLIELSVQAERAGDAESAADALERAYSTEGLEPAERQRVVSALAGLYGRSRRRDALERLLTDEAEREESDLSVRITAARDLAALLATRGDPERALRWLERFEQEAPSHEGLLADRVELARQASDPRAAADALGKLCDLATDPAQRLGRLRDLAPLLEEVRDWPLAFARWGEIAALDPNDQSALAALEREAEQHGDHERLVNLLARRAALAARVDDVRRIRLRRATVLEQRLGRSDEARAELEALLATTGDNLSVLRVLADLQERLAAPLRAAPLWLRASAVARDRTEAADLARRACEAYLGGGDPEGARRVLDGMETWAESAKLLHLRVELERRSENPLGLGAALEDLALASMDPPDQRAGLLLEAARAADAGGDPRSALLRAERAARIAPGLAEPQLYRYALLYRSRGFSGSDEARLAVAELRGIRQDLDADQQEVRAFLVAEALDLAIGTGAGLRELETARSEIGDRPLVALGLAERLSSGADAPRAFALYERALDGDLRGLRRRSRVALAAATAARALGRMEQALSLADEAARDPELKQDAAALQAKLRAPVQPIVPLPARRSAPPPEAASAPPLEAVAPRSSSPVEAVAPRPTPAVEAAASRPPLTTTQRLDPLPVRQAAPAPPPAPPESVPRSGTPAEYTSPAAEPPPAPPASRSSAPPASRSSAPPARAASSAPVAHPVGTPRLPPAVVESPPNRGASPSSSAAEATLLDELARGSLDAGRELVQQLENRSDRAQDLVDVCRQIVALVPGDRWALERLWVAALADGDLAYARAVEHVLRALQPGEIRVDAPALADLPEQPEAVRALLFRDVESAALDALALVWEGAEHVFRRDPGTYGVTGLERVPPGAPTPVGRVYGGAARLLGLTRAPLFQRRSAGAVTISVALLSPPALILSGDPRKETGALRYHIGAMLAATLPEHALLYGSPESQARAMLKGLALAFGSPQAQRGSNLAAVATLAEVLWQSIPTRSQRRLRALCDDPEAITYDTAMAAARLVVRRAGLLVAADLAVALKEACIDEGIATDVLEQPDGLAIACAESAALGDLVRLATSPEYAQARWQTARPGRPTQASWGTF